MDKYGKTHLKQDLPQSLSTLVRSDYRHEDKSQMSRCLCLTVKGTVFFMIFTEISLALNRFGIVTFFFFF